MSFNFPSFKFRDRPNSDTTKSFVNDLRKELENDRKMFDADDFSFFSNAGRPSNLRSRLGQHHPSFFTRNFESPPSAFASSHHGGASSSSSESSSSGGSGERVIPIRVCTSDDPPPSSSSSNKSQVPPSTATTAAREASPKPDSQKAYSTQRNNTTEIPRVKEISRGQRASSAPPGEWASERSGADSRPPGMTECGGGQSKKSSNVRNIPIFVEGGQNAAPGGSHQQQQHKSKGQGSFGGGGLDPNRSSDPESKPTPPKKATLEKPLDPLEKIKVVAEQVNELAQKVGEFNGKNGKDKEYLFLDEMLTRLLIQLDDVVVEGRDDIRQARRECIKSIQKCISDLDIKIQAGNPTSSSADPPTTTTEGQGDCDKAKDENNATADSSIPQTSTNSSEEEGQEKLQNENKNQDGVPMVLDETKDSSTTTTTSATPDKHGDASSTTKEGTEKVAKEQQVREKSLPPESDKMETSS